MCTPCSQQPQFQLFLTPVCPCLLTALLLLFANDLASHKHRGAVLTMAMEASGSGAAARTCHFKLVLLGETAVGKSCLVVRFVRNEFFEYQEPTIGGESIRGRGASAARQLGLHHAKLNVSGVCLRLCATYSCLFDTDSNSRQHDCQV